MARRSRKIIKLLLLLLLLSGILPFVYPFGQPMLKLSDIDLPRLDTLKEKLPDLPSVDRRSGQTVTVYRWRDKSGNWSFGSEPPAGVKAEAMTVNPDANLIRGLPQAEENGAEGNSVIESTDDGDTTSVMGYSADDVSKIMQSAKEAKAAMEQRYKQEEVIINNIE
jgi:hypothetical protein